VTAGYDALDVSLHDLSLLEEVELTVQLMIAANDASEALSQAAVDEILGVPAPRPPAIPVHRSGSSSPIPLQRMADTTILAWS
jgi:hypothetical protein